MSEKPGSARVQEILARARAKKEGKEAKQREVQEAEDSAYAEIDKKKQAEDKRKNKREANKALTERDQYKLKNNFSSEENLRSQERLLEGIEEYEIDIPALEEAVEDNPDLAEELTSTLELKRRELSMMKKTLESTQNNKHAKVDIKGLKPEVLKEMGPEWWRSRGGSGIESHILADRNMEAFDNALNLFENSFKNIPDHETLRSTVLEEIREQLEEKLSKMKPETFEEGREDMKKIRGELREMMGQEDTDDELSVPLEGAFSLFLHNSGNMEKHQLKVWLQRSQDNEQKLKEYKNLVDQAKNVTVSGLFKGGARKKKRALVRQAMFKMERSMDINPSEDLTNITTFDFDANDGDFEDALDKAVESSGTLLSRQEKWNKVLAKVSGELLPRIQENNKKMGSKSWMDIEKIELEEQKLERLKNYE